MGGLDFLNEMSGAKRKSYSGAFQLMPLLKFLVKRAGREFGICEKIAQDRLGLQSMHAFALPCRIALTSSQDKLGLAFFSAALVAWALYLVCGSQCDFTPAITDIFKDGENVGRGWGAVITPMRIIHWQIL